MIKGSEIRVVWDRAKHRWLDADGVPVTFQPAPTAGPRPFLELPPTLPLPATSRLPPPTLPPHRPGGKPRANFEWATYELTMEDFKRLNLWDQMLAIADLASRFPITPKELYWKQQPVERPTQFYRYHVFRIGAESPELVFGGGINKVEVEAGWREKNLNQNLKALLSTRHNLLQRLSSEIPAEQVKAMEKFQAGAMSTPFIATTTDYAYARRLFNEYPPTDKQKAVILVIEGPASRAFDFESEFEKIAQSGGGGSGSATNTERR